MVRIKEIPFFFDPHSKKYTGQMKIMKGWCGSAHSIAKIINLDSFHTISGRPCYIQHYTPYYDMRERFFMSLTQFDQLFDVDKRSGRTFVIDRGIYGLDCFARFEKDYLITWEKGYQKDGWEDNREVVEFTRCKHKNNQNDERIYHFKCQEYQWSRDPKFRRIIVKATNYKERTIMVSILCSNPIIPLHEAVWLICNRWLQENDFKYLDNHFGINQLDSNACCDFSERSDDFKDKEVDSKEYKSLKLKTSAANKTLAKYLLKLNKQQQKVKKNDHEVMKVIEKSDANKNSKECKKMLSKQMKDKKKLVEIENLILKLENEVEEAELNQSEALRKECRIQQLIDQHYKLLDLKRKEYVDALRINASNIFRNLHDKYRTLCNNYRDDHSRLRMLTKCSGFVVRKQGEVSIKLWLPGTIQMHIVKSLEKLVNDVENGMNIQKAPSHPKITIELALGPINS